MDLQKHNLKSIILCVSDFQLIIIIICIQYFKSRSSYD